MNFLKDHKSSFALSLLMFSPLLVAETSFELFGKTEIEVTFYADDGQFPNQDYQFNSSITLEPELYWEWNNGDDSLTFIPFVRGDQEDAERTHADIRELVWTHVNGNWEIHSGIRKVFWGVTEFNHLVDVINQTDGVESFDGEEKLGQPMINVSRVSDWGIIDAFVLLGFRKRTFAGTDGRLRSEFFVDTDQVSYESNDEEEHIDFALRWSHSFNVFDLGTYWFDGTDRQPLLQAQSINGETRLAPYYQQATQVGVDLQATIDSWLWKLEAIHKDTKIEDYAAAQAGFEYTFYGIRRSPLDLGVLLEYGWDERKKAATSVAQNDVYMGARLTLNDEDDSALLMGMSYDMDFHTRSVLIEASKRLSDRWTIALEGLIFIGSNANDVAAALDKDDRVQLSLERFF